MESSSWMGGMGRLGSSIAMALVLSWQWVISGCSLPLKQQENREDRPRCSGCFTRDAIVTAGASPEAHIATSPPPPPLLGLELDSRLLLFTPTRLT
ncbi:hypothetical protein EYF80_014982 [Liparis tanakae]|uniref:Uncharacterized protein n=1 Tax=Liparis tanakae TaxID=230148 RepID=A0A4Z2IBU2_9TELE|nr:hypothetical protein EYF80_014982 [Liparis tanakae]